jgi:hypothetical protein
MPLIDLAEFKQVLGVGDLYEDTQLEQVMEAAEDVITEYLQYYAAKVDQACCPVSLAPPATGTSVRMRFTTDHLFQVGQTIELRGFPIPGWDRRLVVTELVDTRILIAASATPWNPGISTPRPLIPQGTVYLADSIDFYDTIPEVREAALAIAVDLFQSRVAPGGQTEAIDFTPGPYRLGRSLFTRVSGLLGRWMDTGSLVG